MDNRPIGVFDSGLGGLSVVRQLMTLMPHENIVYFGDTGRVPYGTRSEETIRSYARDDCAFLLQHDVKMIIAACGTVSSVAGDLLDTLPVPAAGVVQATAAAAVSATRQKRVGVIGTAATVHSRSFEKAIHSIDPAVAVTAVACPMFVSLVENGWISLDDEVAIAMVRRYLRPIKEAEVDTLILGCTHFPLLAPLIQRELGDEVILIDSGRETALRCMQQLQETDAVADTERGGCRFFVTDRPDGFAGVAEIFLGRSVTEQVEQVSLETFGALQKGGSLCEH